jgi:glycosyltransferase involved in cell wall biosynthesis
MKNQKILFISHEASRTGAPIVLLHLLKWIKKYHTEIQITVLSLSGGDLKEEFKYYSHSYYELPKETDSFFKKIKNRFFKSQVKKNNGSLFLNKLADQRFDIVYSNTILSIPYGSQVKLMNKSTFHIVHVHELNTVINILLPNFNSFINDIDHFIAVSKLVEYNLVTNWGVRKNTISTIYDFSELTDIVKKEVNINAIKSNVLFHVGASGSVNWRKGSDLFIQVARYLKTYNPNLKIKFTWVGYISLLEQNIINEDLLKTQLLDVVSFVGEQKNPTSFYDDFDIFLMISREDPFPLVCIEVGMLGKPIVCFEKATGTAEIIEKGGGYIVPYLSIESISDKIIYYMHNPKIILAQGEINKKEFAKFTPEKICPLIFSVLSRF